MKILLTGSNGVIGNVLKNNLDYDFTEFDLPHNDARQYKHLVAALTGHQAIIHLAWNTKDDNFRSDFHHPDNALKTFNVYRAAIEAGVPRVIMASSVHADKFTNRKLDGLLDPYMLPLPDSPYGAGKCFMESLGRYYADSKGLEVICLRFGGINPADMPPEAPFSERLVWLSHRDCSTLVSKCLETARIPNNYAIMYAVSDNKDRLHDITNPIGWTPQDGLR
jgi:nucleoside-diphosphate-sugar epimerase